MPTDILKHPGFYSDFAVCPETDLKIPKTLQENIHWRRRLRLAANRDTGLRHTLRQACAQSPIFWLNAFGWTFLQKRVNSEGVEKSVKKQDVHVPFITWKVQDEAIQMIRYCIDNGENLLIDKSRDMGASWIGLSVFHWYWQFIPGCTFLEMSRKKDYVDMRGNMDTLFEKHRYLLRMQPVWLQPEVEDNICKLQNLNNGNMIVGEGTNENAGQGARKTAVLLDEFARVREAEEIDLALTDTTACKLYNSTPQGPNTWFSRLKKSKACRILEMPWWRHPDKGRDCKLVDNEGAEVGYTAPPGKKYTSAWYEVQRDGKEGTDQKGRSRRDLAQNVDMCHGQAGRNFFDAGEIEIHRRLYQQPARHRGQIVYMLSDQEDAARFKILKTRDTDRIKWIRGGDGAAWLLWCELIGGRPDQTHSYTLGIDISAGTGSSNSVISVYDATTKRIVAKFVSAITNPYKLAEEAVKIGIWFGGTTGAAVMNWETNGGVGAQFTTQLMKIGYTPKYKRRTYTKKDRNKIKKVGWHSTPEIKEDLLGAYANGLKTGEVTNPCEDALDECLEYIYDDNWKLVPGSAGVDEASGAGATHGDHVVADSLAFLAREDIGSVQQAPPQTPKHSFKYHQTQRRQRKARQDAWAR